VEKIKKLSETTKIPQAVYIRKGLDLLLCKYEEQIDTKIHKLSIGLDIKIEELEKSNYDIFSGSNRRSLDDVIMEIDQNFDLAPSQLILSMSTPHMGYLS